MPSVDGIEVHTEIVPTEDTESDGTLRWDATTAGVAAMAISAVDIALWDLFARIVDQPLCRLLGACRETVPSYGSGGFTSYSADEMRAELEDWMRLGMTAFKIKVGREPERAVDVLMADATRCAGITGFMRVAALAAAYHVPLSSHCAPTLHCHLGAALPELVTAECFRDHLRAERELFEGAVTIDAGRLRADTSRAGLGIGFVEEARRAGRGP